MVEHNSGHGSEKWMSISGQPLDLGLDDSGFNGMELGMLL